MAAHLLAIDVGTSACKTALFEEGGRLVATASVGYDVHYPQPGWAQQHPDDWWRAACTGIRACLTQSGANPQSVAGIGIDGQSWACVAVDAGGRVLAETPLWMDTRADAICREMEQSHGADTLFATSGNPFKPSYTTPKILWFKRHHPAVYQKARWFLHCNSFIVYRLTGVASGDVSQGYGLHMFDMQRLCYNTQMCALLGIDIQKLPPLYPCHAVVGTVTAHAAAQTGLAPGVPVVAGGLDAACGALGAGVSRPGQTQEQGGQAGGMSICLNAPVKHPSLILSAHVLPGYWLLQGGSVGGGGSLKWLAAQLGGPEKQQQEATGKNQFALLDKLAAGVPAGADGVVFLPYLAGERSPLWDPDATGVYFGLRYATTRAHFFRALLEGAAFSLRHNLETAAQAGVPVEVMHAMGGAANSRLWAQIKADVTGVPIRVPEADAATVRGAAILAGVGVGLYKSFKEAVSANVTFTREHLPNPALKNVYDKNYEIYKALYPQLAPVMHKAAQNNKEKEHTA